MYELTTPQWDELIEQYVQLQVDSMDYESLEQFVIQTIRQDMREIESREELCDEIKYSFDEETLDELVEYLDVKDKIKEQRQTTREKRQALPMTRGAIIGYTNAGKSTILNLPYSFFLTTGIFLDLSSSVNPSPAYLYICVFSAPVKKVHMTSINSSSDLMSPPLAKLFFL